MSVAPRISAEEALAIESRLEIIRPKVRTHPIPTGQEKLLGDVYLRDIVKNIKDCQKGGGSPERTLLVIGKAGTGKSFALQHQFRQIPEFQPRRNESNELKTPLISFEADRPCGAISLGNGILKAMGFPYNPDERKPGRLFETVKALLVERGVLVLHLDEAQHMFRHKTDDAVQEVQDRLKSLQQIPNWPLHIICSGVDELSKLTGTEDEQLGRRARVMRYERLNFPGDKTEVAKVLTTTAELCDLRIPTELLEDDFLGRLVQSSKGGFGRICSAVQQACFRAIELGRSEVTKADFSRNYQRKYGCLPADNIFEVKNWQAIEPRFALADITPPKKKR